MRQTIMTLERPSDEALRHLRNIYWTIRDLNVESPGYADLFAWRGDVGVPLEEFCEPDLAAWVLEQQRKRQAEED